MVAAESRDASCQGERFYEGALGRISRFMLWLGGLSLPLAWLVSGAALCLGVFAGSLVSLVNFRALRSSVEALGQRIAEGHSRESGGRIVARVLLRYTLIAAAAYGIFSSSQPAFYGFLAGLCLPVPAMLAEAAYEGWIAVRRGW